MDIDAFKASREESWKRLRILSQSRRLSGVQIDELDYLYRQATSDLAAIRSQNPNVDVIRILSRDIATARARLTGTSGASTHAISRFFRAQLPAALYQIRWWIFWVMIAFFAVAWIQALYILMNPDVMAQLGSAEALKSYALNDFVNYYSQDTNAEFGLSVWVNNAWVALQAIGGGITGFYPLYVLFGNAQNLGVSGAIVTEYGGLWHFFRFILPHGLPELTAVFIAGAAGLKVFWAAIVPGPQGRKEALAKAGRSMIVVGCGCVILLFVSGILEGFVTPSSLPSAVKVTLGVLVLCATWTYILLVGRRAWKAGFDGDLLEDAGYVRPVAG